MKTLDAYSYHCGVMDAFNEILRAGLKRIALSHPCETREERDALLPYARQLCQQYGTSLYVENNALLTDLFPISLNKDKVNIVFYRDPADLDCYLGLQRRKADLLAAGAYQGEARETLARDFGRLLSYSEEGIDRLLAANDELE